MAVNYVKGQILSGVLERDGIDIAIANANVGINTNSPTVALDVNGNIRANNLRANTANIVGNVTVGNISTIGNIAGGNVLTDHLCYANGTPWDLQEPAGSNTQIQFNNNSQFGANANFTFSTAANLLTVNATANIANVNVSGAAVVAGNVTGGNLITGGLATVTGNVTGGNIVTKGIVTSQPGQPLILTPALGQNADLVSSDGKNAFYVNETAAYIQTVDVSNNVSLWTFDTSGNLSAPGNISASANVTGGNVLTGGLISATGNITSGNLTIANTTIVATSANSTITLQPTGTGLVTINTTTGLVIPVGNTVQRPSPGTTGTIRFNTDSTRVEVYDGTEWDTIVAGVTNQTLNGNGTATSFTLNRSTTTAAALVMLNGITQIPDQSYAMTPSPSTNLVFTEAPQTGDVIDVRFL